MNSQPMSSPVQGHRGGTSERGGERENRERYLPFVVVVVVAFLYCSLHFFPWLLVWHGKNKYCIKMLESS